MSLRTRILIILSAVVALYAVVDNGTLRLFANRFFADWEERDAEEHLDRVLARLDDEVETLEELGLAWGNMASVARLVGEESADATSAEQELGRGLLDDLGLDVLLFCDAAGNVRWGRILDPRTREPIRITRELPLGALSASHPLRNIPRGRDFVSGLMMTEREPLLVAAVPVRGRDGVALTSEGTQFRAARHGLVIAGRFLDEPLRRSLGDPSGMEIRIAADGERDLGESGDEVRSLLSTGERRAVARVGEDGRLHVFASRNDLRTLEPLLVEGIVNRDITALGARAVDYALLSTLGSALLILFALLRLLQRFVLNPLGELTDKAIEIGRKDDTTIRTNIQRDDEIGQLSKEFDRMLDELAHSREQVVQNARLAGASEVATGVLHNVGNVLNSVNVSSSLAVRSIAELATADLERMVAVLVEHRDELGRFVTEDPKGKHFLPFLEEISRTLSRQKRSVIDELEAVTTGIEHIADLVRAQQTYAGTKGVFEYADLAREIESALDICRKALGGLAGVEVRCEFEDVPSVRTDKHRLMEILVNLIQNAVQAMAACGDKPAVLTLRLRRVSEETLRIEVADTGCGIAPEDLTNVFRHGFSTKPDGHGFGLHVSANAAVEMDATLRVESDGLGQGATFTIDLPLECQQPAHAA
ncbi:MAG TPA: HAMP domain-containing protein [Planctomycetes bacterium]|nr:HAMP domain-containing protein [Planctomycetota bacterium]